MTVAFGAKEDRQSASYRNLDACIMIANQVMAMLHRNRIMRVARSHLSLSNRMYTDFVRLAAGHSKFCRRRISDDRDYGNRDNDALLQYRCYQGRSLTGCIGEMGPGTVHWLEKDTEDNATPTQLTLYRCSY